MQQAGTIDAGRIRLIAATPAHLQVELSTPERLGAMLGARISGAWPSGEYDRDAMEFFLARLEEGGAAAAGWYGWYAISQDGPEPSLLGAAGFFGPPDANGSVEMGYSVLPEWQRKGYAAEMARTLAAHAFSFPSVKRIVAHTTAANPASIAVLARAGFSPAGAGEEAGTLRFELLRAPAQA